MGIEDAPKSSWRANLAAKTVIFGFFIFAFVAGGYIAGTSFHDPDTCWLLAMGQKIVEQMGLPASDPFSYIGAKGTYVVYQWLTEVLFYGAHQLFGGMSLIFFVAMVLVSAFLLIPVNFIADSKKEPLACLMVVLLAFTASSYHILARPEIFSYLFLSLTLSLLVRHRQKLPDMQTLGNLKWQLPLIFAAWANLHTGFTSGLIALAFYGLAIISEHFFGKSKKITLPYIRNYILLFFGCLVATLINPYGFGLWQYIYHLFFSPFNPHIQELGPLTGDRMVEVTFYPFFVLSALVLFLLVRKLRPSQYSCTGLYSLYVSTYVVASGFSCRRLIMFANIVLLYEAIFLLQNKKSSATEQADLTFVQALNLKLSELLGEKAWMVIVVLVSLLGSFLISSRVSPPDIPQSSDAFRMPKMAMQLLRIRLPEGKVFNDAQYGDVLIWHMAAKGSPVKVFVDTRFDMYGDEHMKNYYCIRNCQKGWKKLFDKYQFDWIFLPREGSLSGKIWKSKDWKPIFYDNVSVIFIRNGENQDKSVLSPEAERNSQLLK